MQCDSEKRTGILTRGMTNGTSQVRALTRLPLCVSTGTNLPGLHLDLRSKASPAGYDFCPCKVEIMVESAVWARQRNRFTIFVRTT